MIINVLNVYIINFITYVSYFVNYKLSYIYSLTLNFIRKSLVLNLYLNIYNRDKNVIITISFLIYLNVFLFVNS